MKKVKFTYNTNTLKFEKYETPLRVRLLRIFGFTIAILALGFVSMLIFLRYSENPDAKFYRLQNQELRENYAVIESRAEELDSITA